jgi:hypothetical protein
MGAFLGLEPGSSALAHLLREQQPSWVESLGWSANLALSSAAEYFRLR